MYAAWQLAASAYGADDIDRILFSACHIFDRDVDDNPADGEYIF